VSRRILIDDDAAQYESVNLRLKRLEQGMLGGKVIRVGSVSIHYSGAAVSDSTVVTHGLGTVPAYVGLMSAGNGFRAAFDVTGIDASTFTVVAEAVDGGAKGPGNATYYWLVIG
jgi:hypothetical protein